MAIETRIQPGNILFGNWEVEKFIGSGSGGKTAVFSIVRKHEDWQETAALKVINILEEVGKKDALAEVYRQEYEEERDDLCKQAKKELHMMSCLKGNSYIVEYHDFVFSDYQEENKFGTDLLIRMELLKSLHDDRKEKGEYSEAEVIHIGQDICKGLDICHKKGIIHRDIKPANIFVTAWGDYKLGDFGIARMVDAGQKASTKMGTRAYAAPEQFMSYEDNYDNRVDIYSLGLTLYELSNHNRLPFANSGYVRESEIQLRILGKELPKPENAGEAFAKVILKACAYDAKERYASAEEFYDALKAAEIGVSQENEKAKTVSDVKSVSAKSDKAKKTEKVKNTEAQERPWLIPAICGGLIVFLLIITSIWSFRSLQGEKQLVSATDGTIEEVNPSETDLQQSENTESGDVSETVEMGANETVPEEETESSDDRENVFTPDKIEKLTMEEYADIFGKASYVTATMDNVAVIAENGDLYIWGNNEYGQVGCGNTEIQPRPVKVLENVQSVEIDFRNTAALTKDGDLYVWGDNSLFQVGNGSWMNETSPILIMRNVKQMSLGYTACGALLENGELYAWGNPSSNGTGEYQKYPALVAENIASFEMSNYKGGAVTNDGELYMWGLNWDGDTGAGDWEEHPTPVKIMDNVAELRLGYSTSSVITKKNELYVWGANGFNQTGIDSDAGAICEPTFVLAHIQDVFWSKEANSGRNGAVIAEDGKLYVWGDNDNGQLGIRGTSRAKMPHSVESLNYDTAKTVVLGRRHTAVIMENGDLYLCGENSNNQINDSEYSRVYRFELVAENIACVATSWDATYAIGTDGSFYCWGK